MSKSGEKVSAEKAGPSTRRPSKWSTRKESLLVGLIQHLKGQRKVCNDSFWTIVERKKIFKFTAQEMKTHFLKVIRPNLKKYLANNAEIQKFDQIVLASRSADQSAADSCPSRPYTTIETDIIIWTILVNTGKVHYLGTTFWKKMESQKRLENRGWLSMKTHFVKTILPNLEKSSDYKDKNVLKKLCVCTPKPAAPTENSVRPIAIASAKNLKTLDAAVGQPSGQMELEMAKQGSSNPPALKNVKKTSVRFGFVNQTAGSTAAAKLQIKKPTSGNSAATASANKLNSGINTPAANATESQPSASGPKNCSGGSSREDQPLELRVEHRLNYQHNIKIMHRLTDHESQQVRQIAETALASFIESTRHAQITLDHLDPTGKESSQFIAIDQLY